VPTVSSMMRVLGDAQLQQDVKGLHQVCQRLGVDLEQVAEDMVKVKTEIGEKKELTQKEEGALNILRRIIGM